MTASNVYNFVYIPVAVFLIWVGFKKETVKWKITAELLAILALIAWFSIAMSIEISEGRLDIPLILALVFALATLGTVAYRMVKIYSK